MSCYAFPSRKGPGVPRATTEHMPFAGHRTCAQWGPRADHKLAREYGFDPDSLKAREA